MVANCSLGYRVSREDIDTKFVTTAEKNDKFPGVIFKV
jgi:hypothetical protein